MFKRILVLGAVIAIIVCALLINMYLLDWVKFSELSENLRKILAIIAVSRLWRKNSQAHQVRILLASGVKGGSWMPSTSH